jgi:hypothetical protein
MTTIAKDVNGQPMQAVGLGASQVVAIGGASAQSVAMGFATRLARMVATVDCHIAIGADPTATTTSTFLPAGVPEYFEIREGQKVAVIQSTGPGNLFVTEAL